MATDEIDTGWDEAPAAAAPAQRVAPASPPAQPRPQTFQRAPLPPLASPPRSTTPPPPSAAANATYAAITARAPLPVRPSGFRPATPRPPASLESAPPPSIPSMPALETHARQSSGVALGETNSNYDIEAPISSGVVSGVVPVISQELATVLEEVDFFIAQGLIRDARTLLLEQLLRAPRHPAIVARLASISSGPASSRGLATG